MYLFTDTIFYGFFEAAYGELSESTKCPKTPSIPQSIFITVAALSTWGCG